MGAAECSDIGMPALRVTSGLRNRNSRLARIDFWFKQAICGFVYSTKVLRTKVSMGTMHAPYSWGRQCKYPVCWKECA